ncbi:MAG: cytochrome C oxidase Cbb3 [Flavobacteriaceae bacterium]|nr:MAG: cytochrome C oxidase Cbb3 [Flavobacteriaceae bacterium]
MKINWGKGIVIAIIFFVGFIMYFVITMTTNTKFNYDLVTEKYYEKELTYQQKIDASKNIQALEGKISLEKIADGLLIKFPRDFQDKVLEGKVFLYRPSDKQLDFELPLSKIRNYLLVPDKRLLDGRWNISIEFTDQNKNYFFSEEIIY